MFLLYLYQQETIKNYQNFYVKDLIGQFIGRNIKQKVKIQQMNLAIFSNQIFLESKQIVLIYSNQDDNAKRFRAERYYLPKGIIKNYNMIIHGKNFYNQAIDSKMK